jgi:hypothetical protein
LGFGIALAMQRIGSADSDSIGAAVRQGIQNLTAPPTANQEVLNNEAVVNMVTSGLGEEVVLGKIKYSRANFALSSSDLAQLKQRGVSDRIITAMLETQATRGATRV